MTSHKKKMGKLLVELVHNFIPRTYVGRYVNIGKNLLALCVNA